METVALLKGAGHFSAYVKDLLFRLQPRVEQKQEHFISEGMIKDLPFTRLPGLLRTFTAEPYEMIN